jgi:hypothetical protein
MNNYAEETKENGSASVLLAVIADINNRLILIRSMLAEKSMIRSATRGCDIRRYLDFDREEQVDVFEGYVEAEAAGGELFVWSLDVKCSSAGWKLQRSVARRTRDGERVEKDFPEAAFDNFSDLVTNVLHLSDELVEEARRFEGACAV